MRGFVADVRVSPEFLAEKARKSRAGRGAALEAGGEMGGAG